METKTECQGPECPHSLEFRTEQAIAKADKATLIHAIRAVVTVKLWEQSETDLRVMLSGAARSGEIPRIDVYNALTGGA